jgi:TPR repeat protein
MVMSREAKDPISGAAEVLATQAEDANSYKMKADAGDPIAQDQYGLCLERGTGVPIDFVRAAEYYKMSAEQGNSRGQFSYGTCLEHGKGVPIDLTRAVEYYKMSADQGDSWGQSRYGLCLAHGKGVSDDLMRATNDSESNPDHRRHSGGNAQSEIVKAVHCVKVAADKGDAVSQIKFAHLLRRGIGTEIDLVTSAEYFWRAAAQGWSEAEYEYGFCVLHGLGIDSNWRIARDYFSRAKDHYPPANRAYMRLLARYR